MKKKLNIAYKNSSSESINGKNSNQRSSGKSENRNSIKTGGGKTNSKGSRAKSRPTMSEREIKVDGHGASTASSNAKRTNALSKTDCDTTGESKSSARIVSVKPRDPSLLEMFDNFLSNRLGGDKESRSSQKPVHRVINESVRKAANRRSDVDHGGGSNAPTVNSASSKSQHARQLSQKRTTPLEFPEPHPGVIQLIEDREKAASAVPEVKIDKLTLSLLLADVSADEQADVSKKFLAWLSEKRFKRGSSKGKGFKHIYLKTFDGGDDFTMEIRVNPSRSQFQKQLMNFTFNPARMQIFHVMWFRTLLRKLFPGRWQEVVRCFRLYRVDVAVDMAVDINSLIVRQVRAAVESKFFVATDSAGRVQSIYLGSIQSEIHGVIYDQQASDEHKRRVGESPTLPELERSRVPAADDAEVVFHSTRFEVRRVFKDLPTLSALENWTAPFDRWDVWQIIDFPRSRKDAAFYAYLDVVRWRGVAGARKYLMSKGCKDIERFEQYLDDAKTNWWKPERFALGVKKGASGKMLWDFLKQ